MSNRDDDRRLTRHQQYRRDRRKFATWVYGLTILFAIISLAQWVLLVMLEDVRNFILENFYISVIFLFLGLLLVSVFVFFESLRFRIPFNWILAFLIVECVTLGMTRALASSELVAFLIAFFVTALVVIIFIIIGSYCGHDMTLDVVVLFVFAVLFFIGAVFFLMLYILGSVSFSLYIYSCFVVLVVLLFVIYHAQTINGGRYAEMRLSDYLLASLIIYHDFVILFVVASCINYSLHRDGYVGETHSENSTTTTEAVETTTLTPT